MINQALKRIFPVLFLLYPLFMFWTIKHYSAGVASALLCGVLVARLFLFRHQAKNFLGKMFEAVLWVILVNNVLNLHFKSEIVLRLYPFVMSFAVMSAFIASLFRGPPMIENFARLYEENLSEAKLLYIRKLTVLWSAWLALNTMISFYTVFLADLETWVLYNNLIFYIVSGVLVSGDIFYRRLRHV